MMSASFHCKCLRAAGVEAVFARGTGRIAAAGKVLKLQGMPPIEETGS